MAGIAYWLVRRGAIADGLLVLEKARVSSRRRIAPDVFSGEAGIGIAALSIHRLTSCSGAMNIASDCAQFLYDTAKWNDAGHVFWTTSGANDCIYTGYSYGVAGIAFYLFEYGIFTGETRFMDMALNAISFVISNSRLTSRGQIYVGSHDKDIGRASYFANGAAGIGAVLVRLGYQLSDRDIIRQGVDFLDSAFSKYSVLAGQFDGLAGILDSMIDCVILTGDSRFGHYSDEIVEGLNLYAYHGGFNSEVHHPKR
jgi:lantibiotic modifying enzyme